MYKTLFLFLALLVIDVDAKTTTIDCKTFPLDRWETNRRVVFSLNEDTAELYHSQINRKKIRKVTATTAKVQTSPNAIKFVYRGVWLNLLTVNRKDLSFTHTKDGLELQTGTCKVVEVEEKENII